MSRSATNEERQEKVEAAIRNARRLSREAKVADWLGERSNLVGFRVHWLFADNFRVNIWSEGRITASYFATIANTDKDQGEPKILHSRPALEVGQGESCST